MRRKAIFILCVLILGAGIELNSQVKYSNEFLAIGVGARMMGMGGAGVAGVNDASASYWNPARLTALTGKMDFSLMHAEYFAGIAKYDYLGAAYRIDDQTVAGLSLIRLGVDDIPNTLELIDNDGNIRYDRIKHFSAADLGVLFSFGRQSNIEGLHFGGSAKIVHRRTGDFASAWGFGLDAAVNYQMNDWSFAAVARDVTGTFNAWIFNTEELDEVFEITGNEIPENSLEITMPSLSVGAARVFKINERIDASAQMDLRFYLDGKRHVILPLGFTGIDPYLGSEWVYDKWLSVRFGFGQFQWTDGLDANKELSLQPNIGLGVKFRNLHIDYALTDIGDLSVAQYSNIVSLRYSIN